MIIIWTAIGIISSGYHSFFLMDIIALHLRLHKHQSMTLRLPPLSISFLPWRYPCSSPPSPLLSWRRSPSLPPSSSSPPPPQRLPAPGPEKGEMQLELLKFRTSGYVTEKAEALNWYQNISGENPVI